MTDKEGVNPGISPMTTSFERDDVAQIHKIPPDENDNVFDGDNSVESGHLFDDNSIMPSGLDSTSDLVRYSFLPEVEFKNNMLKSRDIAIQAILGPVLKWFGEAALSWLVGEGLNKLKNLIFPGSSTLTMAQVLQAIELILNLRLTEEKKRVLEAEYRGFIDLLDRFEDAQKAVKYDPSSKQAKANARDIFVQIDLSMTQRLP